MQTAIALFIAISIVELIIWFPVFWTVRILIAPVMILLLAIVTATLAIGRPSVWTYLIAFLSLYRVVNLFRIIKNRTQIDYLHTTSSVTSLMIIGLQLGILITMTISDILNIDYSKWIFCIVIGQLIVAIAVFASTKRHLRTTMSAVTVKSYTDKELPTLTVAIPARNETDNLSQCIQSLVNSNYPKLEILVLDDCSQNKRTPEIIREFALQGVRFISGQIPPDKWLAKNYAYQQLTEEASGDLIVFCGVDVRFQPNSLRSLVSLVMQRNKSMISLIPVNSLGKRFSLWSLMIQPSRYAWELALPRRLFKRPAVLSTCWIIKKNLLLNNGGFEAVANSISPESYFARKAVLSADGYSFIQSDGQIAISSVKNIEEQRATAIRTRYPQLHRRPEMVAIVTLLEFMALVMPTIILVQSMIALDVSLMILSFIAVFLQYASYGLIVNLTYNFKVKAGYASLFFAAIYDVILLNFSMLKYEFGKVIWKDRNVCLPVMSNRDSLSKNRRN